MSRRTERVNDTIQVELSDLIKRRIKDPKICQLTSITQVITSADLRHARIFVSVMGSDEEKSETIKHLRSAAGYLRTKLSQRLTMRYTPELIFEQDDSLERGAHLLELIDQVCAEETRPDEEQD